MTGPSSPATLAPSDQPASVCSIPSPECRRRGIPHLLNKCTPPAPRRRNGFGRRLCRPPCPDRKVVWPVSPSSISCGSVEADHPKEVVRRGYDIVSMRYDKWSGGETKYSAWLSELRERIQ